MREYRCIAIPRMISENDGIECPIPLSKLSIQLAGQAGPNDANHLASRQTAALRQKLPLAGSKSNFHFTPESRLNSEIALCPKSARAQSRCAPARCARAGAERPEAS